MNLNQTIDLLAGGPGSGCNPAVAEPRCGRPHKGGDLLKGKFIKSQTINELLESDRWDLKISEKTGEYIYPGEQYKIDIAPLKVHGIVQELDHRGNPIFIDSRIAELKITEEDGYKISKIVLKEGSGYVNHLDDEDVPSDGNLFRGISFEEMQSINKTGFIGSKGGYNIGEQQIGLTYFTESFSTARSYASGFAPYPVLPTFGRPSYVIKIKRPNTNQINTEAAPKGEFGVKGVIPKSQILEVYELRPKGMKAGFVELLRKGYGNEYSEGSRSSPDPYVVYKRIK